MIGQDPNITIPEGMTPYPGAIPEGWSYDPNYGFYEISAGLPGGGAMEEDYFPDSSGGGDYWYYPPDYWTQETPVYDTGAVPIDTGTVESGLPAPVEFPPLEPVNYISPGGVDFNTVLDLSVYDIMSVDELNQAAIDLNNQLQAEQASGQDSAQTEAELSRVMQDILGKPGAQPTPPLPSTGSDFGSKLGSALGSGGGGSIGGGGGSKQQASPPFGMPVSTAGMAPTSLQGALPYLAIGGGLLLLLAFSQGIGRGD